MAKLTWRVAVAVLFAVSTARAADKTWDNGTLDSTWNLTSTNWSGTPWSNLGDAAIFAGAGPGSITVSQAILVRSFDFQAGSYQFTGPGSLALTSAGAGALTPGTINVMTGADAAINTNLSTSLGLIKNGAGTLFLGAPVTFGGSVPLATGSANLLIGTAVGVSLIGSAGTVELTAANVLPTNTSVAIGSGWLNIGAFNTTLGSLTYTNTVNGGLYQSPNGNNGVYGSGTLKVTGDIISQYNLGTNGASNTLAANLDMNGGTQRFFTNTVPTALGYTGLHVTGVLSNGSLFKSHTSAQAANLNLYANNTYTGSSLFNGGVLDGNAIAGTNASTALTVVNGLTSLVGTDGSYGAATTISLIAGSLSLNSNLSLALAGNSGPTVIASTNGNRIHDAAAVAMAAGTLQLISQSGAPVSETYGGLTMSLGLNTVTATATGVGGAAELTAAGNWSQSPAAVTVFRGTTLGTVGSSLIKFNGTVPADINGIIPQAYGVNTAPAETGFIKYDSTNGITLLTAGDYNTSLSAGGNVTLAASAASPSQAINSLRATAAATITMDPAAILTVTSGQILNVTGTLVLDTAAATTAFGPQRGNIIALGTATVNTALTGSNGLIKSGTGTLNLNGNLDNLAGLLIHQAGTTTLNSPFPGDIAAVTGVFNLRTNLTAVGPTLTLGNPALPSNTVGSTIGLNIQSVAVTGIAANLVVSNGSIDPTVTTATISQQGGNNGIVQHFSGSITLNSTLNVSGGGNTTNTILFSGPISGAGPFRLQNGNIRFTSTATNYNGPYILGNGGNTSLVTFDGTNASTTGTVTAGPGTGLVTSTTIRFSAGNAMPGGLITLVGAVFQPTATLTLPNAINVTGNSNFDVANVAIAPVFSGPITGTANLTKTGPGTLTLAGNSPVYTGSLVINAGTLSLTGSLAATAATVNTGGRLQGSGLLNAPTTVNAGATLKGGASIGNLTLGGSSSLAASAIGATLVVEGDDLSNSKVLVAGAANTFNLANLNGANVFNISIVAPSLTQGQPYTWELIRTTDNVGGFMVDGTTGTGAVISPTNYLLSSPNFTFESPTLVANANSLVLTFTPVPEPAALLLLAAVFAIRRRR